MKSKYHNPLHETQGWLDFKSLNEFFDKHIGYSDLEFNLPIAFTADSENPCFQSASTINTYPMIHTAVIAAFLKSNRQKALYPYQLALAVELQECFKPVIAR
jgi:hypothetical protein